MGLYFELYFPWDVIGGAEIGSLCEALWWCGDFGMGGGDVYMVRDV
jgi:hypothetical protein